MSKSPTVRASQSTRSPRNNTNPFRSNDDDVFMVNSDIMIGRQESHSDDGDGEDDAPAFGQDNKPPAIYTPRRAPIPNKPRQQPLTSSDAAAQQPTSYLARRGSKDEQARQSRTPEAAPSSPPSRPRRPIVITIPDPSANQPSSPPLQYQPKTPTGRSRNANNANNGHNTQPTADLEMRGRGLDQEQTSQLSSRSPLTSLSTNVTSGTIAPSAVEPSISRSASKQESRITKYRNENHTQDERSGRAERGSTDRDSISSIERAGYTSYLGHLRPSKGHNKYGSRLTADTPESQSAAGSKNNLIRDQSHYLRADLVNEKLQNHGSNRKTGKPGKGGQEPETDMFKYVEVMLDMPENPSWWQVVVKLAKVLAVMTIAYYGLMALYFAAEFQHKDHMKNLDVLVVDLDQGMIGVNFLNFTAQLNQEPGQINWVSQPSTLYPNMSIIQEAVGSGSYWGAVVVQPNASSTLNMAFSNALPDYNPDKAFAFIYDGGRDPLVVKPYIVASMYTSFLVFSKIFNPAWIKFILVYAQRNNLDVSALQYAPQVMGTPVAFEEFDLHPSTAAIIGSATTVAYIWIFLIAGGSTYLVTHVIQPMTRHASVFKTVMMLATPLLVFLSMLSMAYSLLLLTFGVPFHGGVTQFMSLFGGMLLLQCAVSAMVLSLIYLIPVVFIPIFTITFVIMNVIAVFNPVELMPKFYGWAYAMPFLNAVQIARYVLLGSYNRLIYNIPILAVWILVPVVLLPFAISRQKRMAKELAFEEEEKRFQMEMRERQQKRRELSRQQEEMNEAEEGQPRLDDFDRHDDGYDKREMKGSVDDRQRTRQKSRSRQPVPPVRKESLAKRPKPGDAVRSDNSDSEGDVSEGYQVEAGQGRERWQSHEGRSAQGQLPHEHDRSQGRRRRDGAKPSEVK
ncbi:hypothetical protein BGX34_005017 [Mortierella sp. NVP85]|nr:hypothetical protein BGX34_005017 [Mortierella sp. NVP85]